jgi:hypothetical protein
MFSCAECSKDFESQGSLNRHRQNHSQSAEHTCNICGVFFRRRDLLTRHLKLHASDINNSSSKNNNQKNDSGSRRGREATSKPDEPGANEGEGEPGDATVCTFSPGHATGTHSTTIDTGTVSRRRCHTACNRCRDMKIKCNGEYPCPRCLRAGKACEFDQPNRSSGRISQAASAVVARAASTSSASAPSFAADAGFTSHLSMPPSFSPTSFTDLASDQGALVGGNSHEQGGDNGIEAAFGVSSLLWDPTFDQVMPWPWLHENQFLSRDEYDLLDSDISQGLSFSGEHMPDLHLAAFQAAFAQSGNKDKEQAPVYPQHQHHVNGVRSCSEENFAPAIPAMPIPLPAGPSQDESTETRSPDESNARKQRAVDKLVSFAVQAAKGVGFKPTTYPKPAHLWSHATQDPNAFFHIELQPGCEHGSTTTEEVLRHFVGLYSEHFHQLWPLLPRRTLESGIMHPLLYLVLASIGAMYMGGSGSEYGTLLHNAVRQRLIQPLDIDDFDDSLVWLAQARLLIQVAALYFGQPRAFSYAQHLGTLLIAQSRRMHLFSGTNHQKQLLQLRKMKGVAPDTLCLELWLSIEERRRLAFGIFRGDTFTSVLLNTRPLLSLEEIALEFPTCNSVFNGGADLEPRLALDMIEHHRSPNQDMRASDVFHVLLERDEILPPLEPVAHEILLFGLQSHVWRFSYDRQLLERLTAGTGTDMSVGASFPESQEGDPPASEHYLISDFLRSPSRKRRRDTFTSNAESLDNRSYQMADLISEQQRLMVAMEKWERALPLAKSFARNEEDRSYLLSSLILYHLSFMRLHAPVDDVHQIHYRLANKQIVPQEVLDNVIAWKRSARARLAVKRVHSVCSLITQESQKDRRRSQLNFNAYVGLHHGAGILWAYHGATEHEEIDIHLSASNTSDSSSVHHGKDLAPTFPLHDEVKTVDLLHKIEDLFHAMSPARWSSFAEVVHALNTLAFPANDRSAIDESLSH